MLEQAHREADGRLLQGENLVTGERRYLDVHLEKLAEVPSRAR